MSQHDFNITQADADAGVEYRAAVNAALQALASLSSGPTAPTTTHPFQLWIDTITLKCMMRDPSNAQWFRFIDVLTMDNETNTAIGIASLYNRTSGNNNIAVGTSALITVTTGNGNTAIGAGAGGFVVSNNNCTYLGYGSRTGLNGCENETVIGFNATGNGGNTVTLGNQYNLRTVLNAGNLNIKAPLIPESATSMGVKGDIAYDANYVYVCVATNTWKRSALASW